MLRRVGGGCSELNTDGSPGFRAEQTWSTEGGPAGNTWPAFFYRNEFS